MTETENLGGCSGAEGSICAIFYPQAPPAPPATSLPPEIPDPPGEIPEDRTFTNTPEEEEETEEPQPTFVSPHTWRTPLF